MPCFTGEKASKVGPPARPSPEYQVDVSFYPVMEPRDFREISYVAFYNVRYSD